MKILKAIGTTNIALVLCGMIWIFIINPEIPCKPLSETLTTILIYVIMEAIFVAGLLFGTINGILSLISNLNKLKD